MFGNLKPKIGLALAVLVVGVIASLSFINTRRLVETSQLVSNSQTVLAELAATLARVADAETGTRGYVLTGDARYLKPYQDALQEIDDGIRKLRQLTSGDERQQQRIAALERKVASKLAIQAENIRARDRGGLEAGAAKVAEGQGRVEMDEIRRIIAEMEQHQNSQVQQRTQAAQSAARTTENLAVILAVVVGALLAGAYVMMRRELVERRRAEQLAMHSNERLHASLNSLEEHGRQISLLSDMTHLLQSCLNTDEAHAVIAKMAVMAFPGQSGALGILRASGNTVEVVMEWGERKWPNKVFAPEDCWALRRGRIHTASESSTNLPCRHVSGGAAYHLCAPLSAHGHTLGVLCLGGAEVLSEAETRLAESMADEIGLALANLKLHETLRLQSIRDPLTRLFNRRYMEESLEREVTRARRNQKTLGLIMLDVDHFKRFNDTFGHSAGDDLLRAFGELLAKQVRGEDIACRFGGEEFVLILPDAPSEALIQRAERLREATRELSVRSSGQPLGQITASLGVAWYPQHASTAAELLESADAAVYQAKHQGRDRTIVAAAGGAAPVLSEEGRGHAG